NLSLVDVLQKNHFKTAVGPGVYDIHSPRVPSVEEIETALEKILQKLPQAQVWVNPDCGLKTRGEKETTQSLAHLVQAAHRVREKITFSP
ncbi:MAG: 5-methyltetrahydropteroyltriglutamate--homocysteine S-methyltransferase, partial [Fibrobacteraceae bacterium]